MGMSTVDCGNTWENYAMMTSTVTGPWYLFTHLFIYQTLLSTWSVKNMVLDKGN